MRTNLLCDGATAQSLGLEWLAAELEPVSDYGRRAFARLEPYRPGDEGAAAARAAQVSGAAQALAPESVEALRDALRSAPDASGAIARAGVGDTLADADFLELLRFCDALERVDALLPKNIPKPPRCSAIAVALERGRAGKFGFYLDDAFDRDLGTARARAAAAQAEFEAARGRLLASASAALGRADIASPEFIVMRDARSASLPEGVRVIREAPTYYLCELELDESALAALRRRDEASEVASSGEERVRAALSERVREHVAELERAEALAGELDVLLAAVRFTQRYACRPAEYHADASLAFVDAHYLPLQAELEREGRPYVPIALTLGEVAILTGPNMGGKSVALRTCGFIAVCAAFGLPVPAESARVALFAEIAWLGIGVREEPGGLLSSFAGEVVRLRDVLARGAEPALLLIDEFARTTTPDEGRALLLALIVRLRRLRVCALVATHLTGIAEDAGAPHFVVRGLREISEQAPSEDLDEALQQLAALMDYTIEPVGAAREHTADAIFLARLLGLDAEFIDIAWQKLRGREGRATRPRK
ncbi:MAG: hypothetical protein JOZ38_10690 [Candidatus Eremiobacteraeota bacterium]|nr:hypothetical protein [Candidatus Eremiobacteraeota bacterium]